MRLLDRLNQMLGADEGELGREELLGRVVDGILALQRHGRRGVDTFPAGVLVRVTTGGGSLETLHAFVADPSFERDVEANLLNRLARPERLPTRRYRVEAGESPQVVVEEDTRSVQARFVVEGGDLDGQVYPVEITRQEWRVGRGRWHQERAGDQNLPNDLLVTESLPWVSRAAAIIRRRGAFLEVEARAQGEFVVVVKADGTQLRPAMTASGRVPLTVGDRLRFHDGAVGEVAVHLQAVPEEA